MSCPCGAPICANRNESFFTERKRWPNKTVRAVVFLWPVIVWQGRHVWTWCPVVDGKPWDEGMSMGHYDDLETAWADADAWTHGGERAS